MKIKWAIFLADSNLGQFVAFDQIEPEPDFEMTFLAVVEGETPRDAYREHIEASGGMIRAGTELVAIPVAVFGPTDWMTRDYRAAADNIDG